MTRKLKYRPRKLILKGKYYCPIVPELGHYENEGLWGYDKLVHVDHCHYRLVQCLFKTEQERDAAYQQDVDNITNLGVAVLKRRGRWDEEECDELELVCTKPTRAFKVVEKGTRLISL